MNDRVEPKPDQPGFWESYQPGFRFSREPLGTAAFFRDVEEHRYRLEPHIPAIADFARWQGKDVLEVGCGVATDGIRFARAGANYTGIDESATAVALARRRFQLENLQGRILRASATNLPFHAANFDLVWCHGVLHHIDDAVSVVRECSRVLREGGQVIFMVYHRHSFNYYIGIMTIRRLLAAALFVPGVAAVASGLTGEPIEVFEGHRQLLRLHGIRYLLNRDLFVANNTDGPGNSLSRMYTRAEITDLLERNGFQHSETRVRYLNARIFPLARSLERTPLGRKVATIVGWHLYAFAEKRAPA